MTRIDLSRAEWRKSSYSSQDGNCVEVARNLPGLVGVRDSENPGEPKLVISRETLAGVPQGFASVASFLATPLKTWRLCQAM
jgi:Domain of unknown function (DUF397)